MAPLNRYGPTMAEALTVNGADMDARQAAELVRQANILYFRSKAYEKTHWMGVQTAKCPMDMWIYQELLHQTDTDLLIETGTLFGGSALFFAHLFDVMGRGRVLTVDLNEEPGRPVHPRIEYLQGSSVDEQILQTMASAAADSRSVCVILDSDHRAAYKLEEMQKYAALVSAGNYMIAEDTCFDYYPAWPEHGPGPAAAVARFIETDDRFEIDRSMEKHMISFSPRAFLRRR